MCVLCRVVLSVQRTMPGTYMEPSNIDKLNDLLQIALNSILKDFYDVIFHSPKHGSSFDLRSPAPGIPSHPSLLVPLSAAAPSPSSFLDDICWKFFPSSQNLLIPCCALCLAYLCILAYTYMKILQSQDISFPVPGVYYYYYLLNKYLLTD